MKGKNTILIFGIGAILILISVQVFIIGNVWKQKNEMFDLRYKVLSQEAMAQLQNTNHTQGFDTALLIIDRQAKSIMQNDILNINDEKDLATIKKDELAYAYKALNMEQDLSSYLSKYFDKRGFDKNFNFKIVINDLKYLNFDNKITVFSSPGTEIVQHSTDLSKLPPPPPDKSRKKPRSVILVRTFTLEENYFSINFDYLIDFSDKRLMVLKETSASLALSTFSIIVVVILFLSTFRNLMEERRLSNLKTDFINNMTHELKTPLSTITVAGKTLEMEQIRRDDGKILETAKLIGKQSIHLNQLINLILEISMWERTQFQLDKKNVKVDELLKEIVDGFKSGCINCAKITQKYDLDGIKTDLDIVYFTTMINNLLTNAVKYSAKDPEINVEGMTDKDCIYIKVSDNGIGISKTDQRHIFDKFYRVSTGNIHKIKGLGLGLYYVKKIAESHGGDVTVASKPGKGSIFTITLPY